MRRESWTLDRAKATSHRKKLFGIQPFTLTFEYLYQLINKKIWHVDGTM